MKYHWPGTRKPLANTEMVPCRLPLHQKAAFWTGGLSIRGAVDTKIPGEIIVIVLWQF